MTHPPPPSPGFLVCISPPGHVAAGAATHGPCSATWASWPGRTPRGAPAPWGFSGLWLLPALHTPESGLHPCPCPPPPSRTHSRTVGPGASPLPTRRVRGGEGGGQRRGCDSSRPDQCQLQPRFSALCQLALSSGTEVEAGAPCCRGGEPPQAPSPPPTREEPLLPALPLAALAPGPARNWPWSLRLGLRARTPPGSPYGSSLGLAGGPPSLSLGPARPEELEKDHEGGLAR